MAKYIALHTLKKSAEEVTRVFNEGSPEMARAMAAGETPGRCLITWNPIPYGRSDYMFCLWEAENPEDVMKVIETFGLDEYFTLDSMQVEEIDWVALAKAQA